MTVMAVQLLLQQEEEVASSVAHSLSNGMLSSLFILLRDSHLSNIVSSLLLSLIDEISSVSELNSLCQGVLDMHSEGAPKSYHVDDSVGENEDNAHATTGTKRKREQAVSSHRALQKSSNIKSTGSLSIPNDEAWNTSWTVSLRSVLRESLTAAQSIFEGTSQNISRDGRTILNVLRFVTIVVAKYLDSSIDPESLEGCLGVAHCLLQGVEQMSRLVSAHCGSPDVTLRQIVVDVALCLHYVCGRHLHHPANASLKKMATVLVTSSRCAANWLNEDIFSTFGVHSSCEMDFDLAKGGLVPRSPARDSNDLQNLREHFFLRRPRGTEMGGSSSKYVSVASLEVLYGLSLGFRCVP
jgi:hypothetical protein